MSVSATSTAYPAKSGAVVLNITQPPVRLWSISPSTGKPGTYALSLNGANFTASSGVAVEGATVATSYDSATRVRATYVNRRRINRTRCVAALGHDAASYHGHLAPAGT